MQDKVTKNRRFIYDQMVQNDYDLEDFDSFSKQLDNEDARKELYDMLRSDDFNVGEYSDFANKIYAPITEPEKPFAQSRSVAPTPSEKPEEEKVQLSFTTPQKPQLQSLQVEQKEYPTIAETTQKKMAEGVAQRQQLSDMTTSVQRSLNRRGAELDEAQKANTQSYIPQGTAGSIPAFDAGRMYDPEYRDYAAAKESLQNAQAIIDAAGKEAEDKAKGHTGLGGYIIGQLRGADESFGDLNTWSMGLKDTSEGHAILKALDAAEEGTLSESQQALLDAKVIEIATSQAYSSSLGKGYKTGKAVAETIPFMIEFVFNPIAGAGNTVANKFARYALKRFGKDAIKRKSGAYLAGKVASQIGADALAAQAMAATTGIGNVASNALERMQGDIHYQPNEEGKVAFWKREGGDDSVKAFAKAYASTSLENFSEMFGRFFTPMNKALGAGITKGLDKVGLESVNQMLQDVKANDLAQLVADFEKNAQWSGSIGEFAEEQVNGILNALIVGDQTLDTKEGTGVFNKENMIDTALQTATLGAIFSTAKTIDYPLYKYHLQKDIKNAQLDFDDAFGKDEEVAKINEALTSDDPRIAGEVLRNIIGNDNYTQEQQMSAAILAKTVQKYKGAKLFDEKMRNDPETPVEKVEVADSYDKGRNIATPQEKNDALNDLEAQEANIREQLIRYGYDSDADIDEYLGSNPIGKAQEIRDEGDLELADSILGYVNAKAVYDGMTDGINERIATTIEESDRLIDSHINKDDNLIHAAILKGVDNSSDRKVYIISGAFARNEDGTIDTTDLAEGASMIVMDATSGKKEFIDPRNLKDIAEAINPAEEKQRAAETITNEIATKEEAEIAGTLAFVPNDIYTIADENGAEHTATIVADNQDGNVQVIIDNAQEPMLMPKEKVQQMADAYNIGRANAKIAEKKAQSTIAQSSTEVKPVIPMDEQGKPIYEQAPVEATWAELLSLNDGNAEEAIDTAKIMRDNAKKALDKANKAASAKGDTVEAIQQAKAERKALIDAAQAKYDYWDNVANYQASQTQEVAEPTTAEEQTPIVENASFDENINEVEQVYNEESNERSTENTDVSTSVPAEDGIADGDQAGIEMVQGAGTDITLGDRGSIETGQGSNESNVGEGVADVPSADVFRAEEVDAATPQLSTKEEMRRKPLRARAKMWETKVGVPVHLIETFEEVPTEDARKAISDGKVVTAWVTDGEVYLYMPYLRNRTEVDKTYIHEVVAHVGMKRLLGKEGYRQFCMRVYNEVMTEADRDRYDAYPNVKNHAQAADEYIAHLSETTDLESSIWQKVVRIFRDALRVLGIETALTNKDIQDLLRDSYKNLTNEENVAISESEGAQLRSVYHGSGSDFGKFDHTFMGTGEGHQAFGWGTYVTDVEGIGKQYAKMTGKPRLTFKGEFVDSEELNNPWRIIKDLYDSNHGKLRGMRNDAERIANMVEPDNAEMKDLWDNVVRTLSEVRSGDLKITPARYLYSVEIPDNDGTNYLEYGKPLSKTQLNRIKRALYNRLIADTYKGAEQELKEELDDVFAIEKELDGRDIYGTIATYLGSDKAASEFLNESGYVGISYPADGGNAGKARNYVIFNESDLDIKDSTRFRVKEKAPETVSVQDEHLQTVISSADGTKILKNIDSAIEEYKNDTQTKEKTFLGRVAKAIGAKKQGSGSQYATFEAKNGKVFTIRLADHNAKVSTFDIHNEKDGISIIITAKSNEGIQNDGDAHIVEYFYDSIKLRKADGKPLVEILKSIKQTLYSGEYKDTTGLAEREEVNIRDGVRFRIVDPAPTFYSNAERAAENVKQEKATPEQWLKMIEKNGGLKAGEDKWLGLSDWLKSSDKKTLTKQEVLDFIKENQIQIEEVVYGDIEDNPKFKELEKEYQSYYAETYDSDVAFQRMVDKYGEEFDVAFNGSGMNLYPRNEYGSEDAQKYLGVNEINSTRRQYTTDGLDNKREIALTVPTIEDWRMDDEVHFGDAGNGRAIAWVRFGETTDAEGNRVLVIDEVQSNRHQVARDNGYRSSEAYRKMMAYRAFLSQKYPNGWSPDVMTKEEVETLSKLNSDMVSYRRMQSVPEAPFEKNWAELAMKRMLRYAAENGFDKIAWTTGDQQAERYDIGGVAKRITSESYGVDDNGDATRLISIILKGEKDDIRLEVDKNGVIIDGGTDYEGRLLNEIVGKENAVRLMARDAEISGNDLRIGGSGMKAFYDQMIPSFMNKYGKKWGVKVGEVTMPSLEENNTMHSIDVTDAMRVSVMQGQPMFRISDYDRQFADLQSEYDALDKNDEKALNEWREKKVDVVESYLYGVADNFGMKPEIAIFNGADEQQMREAYDRLEEAFRKNGATPPSYEAFKEHALDKDVFATYYRGGDIITNNLSTKDQSNDKMRYAANLFHEVAHHHAHILYNAKELKEIWDDVKGSSLPLVEKLNTARLYKDKSDASKGNEFIAHSIGALVREYKPLFQQFLRGENNVTADDVVKKLNYKKTKANFAVTEILNRIKDEYQESRSRVGGNISEGIGGGRPNRVPRRVLQGDVPEQNRGRRVRERGGRPVLDSLLNDVAQRGLREMVGEDAYNAFLMRAMRDLDEPTRRAIMENGMRNGLNFHEAAEEYLASLAEQDNVDETYLSKVNALAKDMLQNAGIEVGNISNNELRYMLWRSHLQYDGIFSLAEDVVMRSRLGVGNYTQEADIRFRVAPSTPSTTIVKGEAKGVRESFDDMVKRASYQMKEAGYDRYQSIKEFMRMASKAHGVNLKNDDVKEIVSYENPYIALLNKSSINEKEVKAWEKKYYIPIIDAIQRIYKDGKGKIAQLQQYFGSESMDDILNNYTQGKHGLERNRDMAVRKSLDNMAKATVITKQEAEDMLETVNADLRNDVITPIQADARRLQINNMLTTKKYDEKMVKHQTERWDEIKDEIRKNDKLTWEQKQRALDKAAISEFGVDLAERDYSGLGEVFRNKGGKLQESIEAAYKAVVAFEEAFDTADLWKAIKAANDATLEKAFMSSIINRETYNNIRNMYDYYIPLRGFEAKTTEDVYGYLNNEPKAFSMPVKRANGRASKAEFAIPHILQMAHSAILQGNNNLAKLTMANFAQHYPSDLVKQSNMWIEYDETEKEWKAKFPEGIDKNTPIDEVTRIIDEFNANMEELAKDNPKKYRKVKGKMDVPYIVQKKDEIDHQIRYKRNGVDYILTVNGSPRLAYVMNGEIDKAPSVMGEVGEKVEGITRFLSGMYTQYNPDFMVSNFFRDGSFVLSTVPVREDAKYAAHYYKNYFLNNPLVMTRLFNKYEAGTLNRDNYIEAAFEDFLKHGGETGYAILRDVEETKKKVKKDIHYGLWNKAKALIDRLGIVGRGVESSARFAAYLTSREAGRTIARSVYDAKEVSVNFNRKGAGAVFNNLADQNFWGKMVGNTAGIFKITHAFFNAGVQGLAGVSKLVKHNPVKGGMWLASPFLLGVLIASLYDDDDEYYNLTETVRRQNIMIRMGDDYVSIPLAIELRALYGIGEMMVSLTRGKEDLTQKDVAYKIAEQILQAFPINVLEGNGGFDALMPTAYAMVQELMVNEDWQGIPIYREDKYAGEEYKPEWRMVNNYTDERLVAASKFLSKATGGNYGKRGGIEINPAVVQHIMEGMFGGPVSFANKVLAQYDVLVGDKEFEWRNVPFLNRLVKDGGGKAQERMLNREYRNNEERYEEMHSQEGDYQKFIKDESNSKEERAEYQQMLDELRASEEYKMLNRFHQQSLEIDKMYKAYKDQGILDEQMPTILERKEIANAPLRQDK